MYYHDFCKEACLVCAPSKWCLRHQQMWKDTQKKQEQLPAYVECPHCKVDIMVCGIHTPAPEPTKP